MIFVGIIITLNLLLTIGISGMFIFLIVDIDEGNKRITIRYKKHRKEVTDKLNKIVLQTKK